MSIITIAAFVVGVFFVIGYAIAAHYFKEPLPRIFAALAIGVGLCALAIGILFVGCSIMLSGIS